MAGAPLTIRCGTAHFVQPGSSRSGDVEVVHLQKSGAVLAAVDGLGHGESAACAADIARRTIQAHLRDPLSSVVQRCHAELRSTRGVVMSIATIDLERGRLSWLGIGNVRSVLYRAPWTLGSSREELLLRAGVVGAQLPPMRVTVTSIAAHDTLVFATDGIRSSFADDLPLSGDPQEVASRILAQHGRRTDDALVVVARVT